MLHSWLLGGEIVKELRVNRRIFAKEVLVIGEGGEQLGAMPTRQALEVALERDFDLVEVAPNSNPPVCRLLDYGKYRYDQAKKEKEARKGQHVSQLREVRMRCRIKEHDLEAKIKLVKRLLGEGDKVKVSMMFRGREISHPERGREIFRYMASQLKDVALVDQPQVSERTLVLIFSPIRQSKESKKEIQEEGASAEN